MADPNTSFARTLVAALAAAGVTDACVSPGSRNTPLSIALADSPITDTSHHDERSASFFALGIAKVTRRPVLIVTTSGTAAVELHPAMTEADASRVPLIALTADRPDELYDVAAPQTIDQRNLFGTHTRWAHDLEASAPTASGRTGTAALGARLVAESTGFTPGPVHLNIRFREPLVIGDDPQPDIAVPALLASRPAPDSEAVQHVAAVIGGKKGMIVAGPLADRSGAAAVADLATTIGWPVMSDPISGLRSGGHDIDSVVGSDLLAASGWLESAAPEAVLRLGAPPTSKALRTWLAQDADIPQVLVAGSGWPDPDRSATSVLRADPGSTAASLARHGVAPAPSGWGERWKAADTAASAAAASALAAEPFPTEPGVVDALHDALPDGSALWAASSMPIRDVDSFFPVTGRPLAIHANRGANGIDGFVSTALGSASAGLPTVALAGDLSLLHDVGALASMSRMQIPLTVVVVNNDGGGIFHFLSQAGHRHFERHFGTPHGLSFATIASAFGIDAVRVDDRATLTDLIDGAGTRPLLVEVPTDRDRNVALHQAIADAVRSALTPLA